MNVALFKKEVSSYFHSLVAYLVVGVFLLLAGLVTWFFADSNVLDYGFAELTPFFSLAPWLFFILVPGITMRLFAEEYRNGTIELLFTKPFTNWGMVLSKFFAAWLLVALALVPTLLYYYSVYTLGNPQGNIDTAAVVGAYFGLLLLGGVFVSIGLLASSLTENQLVAFVLAALLSYTLFEGLSQVADLFDGSLQFYLDYASLRYHYGALSRGVIDTRNVLYFISATCLFLLLTHGVLSKKR